MSDEHHQTELAAEREYVEFLYRRLAEEEAGARTAMVAANAATASLNERDATVAAFAAMADAARIADSGLCFGRLTDTAGEHAYIGRIGLFDAADGYRPQLLDWRAPAAKPFYCATPAHPDGIAVRRQFQTRRRQVVDFRDEFLDGRGGGADNSALLVALDATRGETMRDIVATIQAEQDDIIRLPSPGVLVVDGGPGTGKTAVALHRVAYLLYTERDRLARRGVLVLGPNPAFLGYISTVLPSLGETAVVFATTGTLVPGTHTDVQDSPEVRRVKGSLAMVDVLTAAVADRQELPGEPIPLELDDITIPIDDEVVAAARAAARATGLKHNAARTVFAEHLLALLTERGVDLVGEGWLEPRDTPGLAEGFAIEIRKDISESPDFADAVRGLWPRLTARRLLADLYASPARLAAACGSLSRADRALLARPKGARWTVSDVPLLDEAVELLGSGPARREVEPDELVARELLQMLGEDMEMDDGEELRAVDVVSAQVLTERHAERDDRDLAERAAADREWTYGHVVVDEAQELSEMDWRAVMRRCPSRSVTAVGDLAQRQSPAGARSWESTMDRYVADRFRYRELTVNYRTPEPIMALAAQVLAEVDPALRAPKSVRLDGCTPTSALVPDLAAALPAEVAAAVAAAGDGTVAVITPEQEPVEVAAPARAFTPAGAKGLEFDVVLLLQPQRMDTAELYVALTRATQRLRLLHTEPLPEYLATPPGPR